MNAISVSHISKSFIIPHERRDTLREWVASGFKRRSKDVLHAIDDVSFTVKQGESFGIIGRNGSGKSTLLKVLAGIYPVDSGKVVTNGKISPFLELGVGFNYDLSARDNVYLNGTVLGLSKAEIDAQFDEIIAFAELEQFVDQKLKNFSSGMQVRLAFSVAIKANADIYLMDEVLAVGDMAFQQKCFEVFRQFKKEGKTLIFVSHDLSAMRQYCDRCLYLKGGKEIATGKTEKILDEYVYEDRKASIPLEVPIEPVPVAISEVGLKEDLPVPVSPVRIAGVRILDKKMQSTTRIVTNDAMSIEVELESQGQISAVVVGIMLKDIAGEQLFGTNTEILKSNINVGFGLSTCKFCIESFPIRLGPVHVTVAVRRYGATDYLDWKDNVASFDVIDTTKNVGLVHIDTTFSMLNSKPRMNSGSYNLMDNQSDWDILLLIDACRFDTFQKLNALKGQLSMKHSVGSCTTEWFRNTFNDRDCSGISYISANPFISDVHFKMVNLNVNFQSLHELWDTAWNTSLKTVKAEDVIKKAKEILPRLGSRKMVIHFIQPHHPFIGKRKIEESGWQASRESLKGEAGQNMKKNVYEQLKAGEISSEDVLSAYEDNLKYVLDAITLFLHDLPGDRKVIITSDHGDCFGEHGIYAHPEGLDYPELIDVPFFTLDMSNYQIKPLETIVLDDLAI